MKWVQSPTASGRPHQCPGYTAWPARGPGRTPASGSSSHTAPHKLWTEWPATDVYSLWI